MPNYKEDFKDKSIEWLEGYLSACYNFAVWHDGEMTLGCGMTKYKTVKDAVQQAIEEKANDKQS